MMRNFVFITDLHLGAGAGVRTGDVYLDLCGKVKEVVSYANEHDATILIAGDVFHRPTIADFYKTPFLKLFAEAKYKPVTIRGNHDELYRSRDNDCKTSYNLACQLGIFTSLDGRLIEFDDFVITNDHQIKTFGKPQIGMFHGFLNAKDGGYEFMLDELTATEDPMIILLGHDHVPYEPLQVGNKVVLRPGSLLRSTRTQEHNRTPVLVHIVINNGEIKYKEVPLRTARDYKEIFKEKQTAVSASEIDDQYAAVIERIKEIKGKDETLSSVLDKVCSFDTKMYILECLTEFNKNLK